MLPFKNCCPGSRIIFRSLTKHFKGFGALFTKLHAKLDADTLLDFFHPSQTKQNTKSKKHLCKNNVCSQHSVT
jgi:hypothetical protein